jgi:hypothetical protein
MVESLLPTPRVFSVRDTESPPTLSARQPQFLSIV